MIDYKFDRSYRLQIDLNDGSPPIVIGKPLTLEFTLVRNITSSLNNLRVQISNLSENTRSRIFQDRFVVRNRKISLELGYQTLTNVFAGTIFEANSYRNGTDIITEITSLDGSYDAYTTMTFETFQKGKSLKQVMEFLIGQFPTLEMGAVGDFNEVLERPVTLNGNTFDLLKKYSNNQVFIDMGKVYVLKSSEVIPGQIPVLNPSTGLLETPRRDDSFLQVTTLLEPRVNIGQVVELNSTVMPVYNGQYKVLAASHKGVISGAMNGPCSSVFNLWVDQFQGNFNEVVGGTQ